MSGHQFDRCPTPRWIRRWRHRVWVCDCGKAWSVERVCASFDCIWAWRPFSDSRKSS